MAKQSQLERAIAALKADRDVLDMAIAKLEAQQTAPTVRKLAVKRGKTRSTVVAVAADNGE